MKRQTLLGATAAAALALLVALGGFPAEARGAVSTLRGTVRLEDGTALRGASVSVAETGDAIFSRLVTTAADGGFSVEVPAGTYRVTAFPKLARPRDPDRLPETRYGIEVDGLATVDVVLRRATTVQTNVVSADGRPLAGARVEVLNPVHDVVATAFADETGWARFGVLPESRVVVTPPADGGAEMARTLAFAELSPDEHGVAAPVVLEPLGEREQVSPDVFVLRRSRAAEPALRIAVVSEGYTALEEPFEDSNGNGVCDHEPFLDANGDGRLSPGERYVDANQNGRRDAEPFDDLNGDGVCNRGERERFLDAATDSFRMALGQAVFAEWRDRIEIVAAFVPSAQAGSSFPTAQAPIVRDTAFGSEFLSTNFNFRVDDLAASAAAAAAVGPHDALVVLTYDLFGVGRESAGRAVLLFGEPRPVLSFVAAHELGHRIGGLADEYFAYDGAPPYTRDEPDQVNVTRMSAIGELKWGAFVRDGMPLPTPDGRPGVGAFEGGLYRRRGIARPSYNCLMRSGGPFCPVCADAMMRQIAGRTSEGVPAAPEVLVREGATIEGARPVGVLLPDLAGVVRTQLLVDGAPHGAASALAPFGGVLDANAIGNGGHTLAFDVAYADGRAVRTQGVRVTTRRRDRSRPDVAGARLKGGSIVLEGAEEVVVPGAVALVGGGDRFPLATSADGTIRTARGARGSLSGAKVAKSLRRAPSREVVVVNPDGGRVDVRVR